MKYVVAIIFRKTECIQGVAIILFEENARFIIESIFF